MSSRFKPWGLRVLIMWCTFIRSFCFYLGQILMLSLGGKRNRNSVLSKYFGLIRLDISMLDSNSYHFIRGLAEAFSSAVLQKRNGLLHCWWNWKAVGTSVSWQRNCVTHGIRFFLREGIQQKVTANHSVMFNRFVLLLFFLTNAKEYEFRKWCNKERLICM